MSLPAELLSALEAEQAQFRGVALTAVAQVRFEGALVALQPVPSAEQDWAGGVIIALDDAGDVAWSGEVLHVDGASGDVFVLPSGTQPTAVELARATQWLFKPFDFSQALVSATKEGGGRLTRALRWVHDGAPELARPERATSLDGPWDAEWGLLWGPPGTGKTQALATHISFALRQRGRGEGPSLLGGPNEAVPRHRSSPAHGELANAPHPACGRPLPAGAGRGERLLIVAPTNGAVDELTHRLCSLLSQRGALFDAEGRCVVFRGGVGARARLAHDFPQCLHDEDPARRTGQREALQRELAKLLARQAPAAQIAAKRAELKEVERLEDATLTAIDQGHAQVIALTVHRALRLVNELQPGPHFAKVIIDEGGMVSRAAAALLSPLAESTLVAGDPRQLGPVSKSPDGTLSHVQRWLRDSALSHLHDAKADVERSNVCLLRTQHRMHPEIAKVVSEFQYGGQLEDGARPKALAEEPPLPGFPHERAVWLVLDESTKSARELSHDRPETGRGYVRRYSAELLVALAGQAIDAGHSVLAATPYRAQAQLINTLCAERGTQDLVASTIHRQQGAEFDVVFVDTVAAGRPFQALTLCAMLNVAASRARRHLVVLSSRAEAEAIIPARFLGGLQQVRFVEGDPPRLEPVDVTLRRAPPMPRPAVTLGASIANHAAQGVLFTEEQLKLIDRQFGDGHYLVRGVAGSGKTFVLASWVARLLSEHRGHRVLVSYFTKSLQALEVQHLRAALERQGLPPDEHLPRVHVGHVDEVRATARDQEFDAVFVDEAQDMGAERLKFLFFRAREVRDAEGRKRRRFFLFMDDSQNIYAQKPIEEFREQVDRSLNFAGRSRVMKESFRSPREILDLAFNVVLDPLHAHGVPQPGLREFLKENELVKAGLLQRPAEGREGLYRVGFTERTGAVPRVLAARDVEHEQRELVRIVRMLRLTEQVRAEDILVVSPVRPHRWAEALTRAGFKTVAFGGASGADPAQFPVAGIDFIRATTLFSSKGHECPVVIFCGVEDLDSLEESIESLKTAEPRVVERQKRCLFYVGATRASVRQYVLGLESSRFVRVAKLYADSLSLRSGERVGVRGRTSSE